MIRRIQKEQTGPWRPGNKSILPIIVFNVNILFSIYMKFSNTCGVYILFKDMFQFSKSFPVKIETFKLNCIEQSFLGINFFFRKLSEQIKQRGLFIYIFANHGQYVRSSLMWPWLHETKIYRSSLKY